MPSVGFARDRPTHHVRGVSRRLAFRSSASTFRRFMRSGLWRFCGVPVVVGVGFAICCFNIVVSVIMVTPFSFVLWGSHSRCPH